MPKVIFEGDTQAEIVAQVKRWLASTEAEVDGPITVSQAIEQGADLTKDALRIIAAAAPTPVAQNDVFKALTDMGYKATESTRDRLIEGIGLLDQVTDGGLVEQARDTGRNAVYQMNATVAKQILKALRP